MKFLTCVLSIFGCSKKRKSRTRVGAGKYYLHKNFIFKIILFSYKKIDESTTTTLDNSVTSFEKNVKEEEEVKKQSDEDALANFSFLNLRISTPPLDEQKDEQTHTTRWPSSKATSNVFRSPFVASDLRQSFKANHEAPHPPHMRIVQRNVVLRQPARSKHICPPPISKEKAREISFKRKNSNRISKNTVFEEPNHWNLCEFVSNSYTRRIVSSSRVPTVQCRRNGSDWVADDAGYCFAIFNEDVHLEANECFRTALYS